MNKSIYDFNNYKHYLVQVLGARGERRGNRVKLAQHLNCQTAYISQVLNGHAQFSLEQAFEINSFLGHDRQEGEFFLLQVQWQRAGTVALKKHFQKQMEEILKNRALIKNRVESNQEVSSEHRAQYYSSWLYAALHVAISVPGLQTKAHLSEYFGLSLDVVAEAMEFLARIGLVQVRGNQYQVGSSHIHLGHDSHQIMKHHLNWRLQALTSLERRNAKDLHYSVVFSLSQKDAAAIRERFLSVIQENLKQVAPSPEETVFATTLDFFEIKRPG
ncbi:MAG: TIGR02147 family protein [Bdellovibrionaceae bacterium]|nr:TIGR02147 family protein [Pseudobdellovibrionaceae bacterium]